MSQAEEAIARLTQVRGRLALIIERLLDIEARLAVAKVAERPAKISLREFTSNLLSETRHHSPRIIKTEKYGAAVRQSVVK
jgi:hypothetical protein